jgi:MFS family permease
MVYDMTESGALLGAVASMQAIPFFFAAPLAGAVTDRLDRRLLFLITLVALLLVVLPMSIITLAGLVEVWHLFVFSLVSGVIWAFNNPTRQSLVPNLVPKEDLLNAYSLNAAAFQSMAIIGPAIGGFMIAWFGAGGNFLLQCGAIIAVIGAVMMMRVPPRPAASNQTSIMANMAEGFRYVHGHKVVFGLVLIGIIPSLLTMPLRSLMPIFAVDILEIGSEGLGIMLAMSGAGALVGAIFLASMGNMRQKGLLMLGAIALTGFALMAFSQSRWLAVSLTVLLFQGLGEMSYWSANNTVLQTVVPDELRGRVTSIYMLTWGVAPLGTLTAGALADLMGAPATITLMGAATAAFAFIAAFRMPHIRNLT